MGSYFEVWVSIYWGEVKPIIKNTYGKKIRRELSGAECDLIIISQKQVKEKWDRVNNFFSWIPKITAHENKLCLILETTRSTKIVWICGGEKKNRNCILKYWIDPEFYIQIKAFWESGNNLWARLSELFMRIFLIVLFVLS